MSDIADRLLEDWWLMPDDGPLTHKGAEQHNATLKEAADEIRRLKRELSGVRAGTHVIVPKEYMKLSEVSRLKIADYCKSDPGQIKFYRDIWMNLIAAAQEEKP